MKKLFLILLGMLMLLRNGDCASNNEMDETGHPGLLLNQENGITEELSATIQEIIQDKLEEFVKNQMPSLLIKHQREEMFKESQCKQDKKSKFGGYYDPFVGKCRYCSDGCQNDDLCNSKCQDLFMQEALKKELKHQQDQLKKIESLQFQTNLNTTLIVLIVVIVVAVGAYKHFKKPSTHSPVPATGDLA